MAGCNRLHDSKHMLLMVSKAHVVYCALCSFRVIEGTRTRQCPVLETAEYKKYNHL